VLVGDAFCTVCPNTGTGVDKALTDAEQLCTVHIPNWLKTPGMGWDKIAQFYADPVKVGRDSSSRRMSLESRSIKMDSGAYWAYRRMRSRTLGRARLLLRNAKRALRPR
jgi:2-polyprenyl-6-methoxyphenol hydroxylase-like FAD-dependent oxidoreductase